MTEVVGAACLRALREHYLAARASQVKLVPEIDGSEVVMQTARGEERFPVSAPTGYVSSRQGDQEVVYPLGPVVLLVKEMVVGEKKISAYVAACGTRDWRPVGVEDRRDVIDFVTGVVDKSPQLKVVTEERPSSLPSMRALSEQPGGLAAALADSDERPMQEQQEYFPFLHTQELTQEDINLENYAFPLALPAHSGLVPGEDFSFAVDLVSQCLREEEDKAKTLRRAREREKRDDKEKAKQAIADAKKQEQQQQQKRPRASSEVEDRNAKEPKLHDAIERHADIARTDTAAATTGDTPRGVSSLEKKDASKVAPPPTTTSAVKIEPYIIVVPSAATSTLTLLNAAEFLVSGRYVSNAEKRAAGTRRDAATNIIEHVRSDGSKGKFRIVDNPTKLDSREWDKVVAVFAVGPTWQFKNWKISEPVDLFHRVLGVHLQFDDEQTPASIKSWNVRVLKLSKTKRHLDQPVALDFWRNLDDFLARRKVQRAEQAAKQHRQKNNKRSSTGSAGASYAVKRHSSSQQQQRPRH